jgi:signal transduction histidine kinase
MNNLAGTIPNWVALIKRQLGPVSRQNERLIGYLNNIVEDAERILLEARRLKEPISKPEKVNLGGLVKSIVAQTELATAPDVEIVLECEEDLPFVRAIRSQLENAVLSIIQNAIKSISGKGRITINARQSMDLGQEMIRLEILDTGCGIPADRLDSIFELGTVYWSDGKGTGYGLWRARSIVESIGGKISVDSILGKGSTFTILLPPAEGSIPSYRSEDSQQ